MNSLAMHITYQKLSFLCNNVLLGIATNRPVLLMTGFVLQGHIFKIYLFHTKYSSNVLTLPDILLKTYW